MIGHTLGHFEILEKIGEGGMGVVYKARDTHLDRVVAIKILPADLVADPDRRRRFVQEAKAASALNHPGIVTIHDIAQHGGIDFMVMEYVPGRTLDRVIPRRGLPLNAVLDYGGQMIEALSAAHTAGIVHRDLKPANVIVSDQGHIKLLDFGIAKLVDRGGPLARDDTPTATNPLPVTNQGTVLGTVAYMAPEQAEGKLVDARADIFSFGAVLHEMVTGQRAFQGDSPLSTLTAILREEPKPVGQIREGLPRELERLITRCLQKHPDRRWQTVADIGVALRELKEESDSAERGIPPQASAQPHRARAVRRLATLVFVITASVIGGLLWRNRNTEPVSSAIFLNAVPLTTHQGREQQPALSPDGNSVAFSWNGEKEDNWDVYVKLVGSGSPLRLTTDPSIDLSPAWSRDGRSIAFVRIRRDRQTVIIVPSLGGPEREVAETGWVARTFGYGQILSWSLDSRILVIAGSPSAESRQGLTVVDVATGETRSITTPPLGMRDSLPSVSPNGRTMAFVRLSGVLTGRLNVQPLSAAFAAVGEPQPLGSDGLFYHGVTWSADGRDVIVSSGNTGEIGLWRIPLQYPDRPERLSPSGEEWRQPTVALQQNRLAFARATWDENLYSITLSGPGRPAGAPVGLSNSTRLDLNAQFSPNGTRIVFESLRSGTQEIWVADADGRNALQLTSFNGLRGGTPAWSADGQWIAFDLRKTNGRGDIYVIPARGGAPAQVTNDPADDLVPSWSHDGRWIYFGSTHSGKYQIWKVSPRGGEAVQVTQHGGTYAKESPDGRSIYYARTDTAMPSIWRVATSGGEEAEVLGEIATYENFAVARDGVYFESAAAGAPRGNNAMFTPFSRPSATIGFLSFATGKVSPVMTIPRHAGHGLDVSPDGRTLLFGQVDSFTEDLMLVEKFR